ncbi:MAG: dephospho-CoA kinase [Clostridiales bacterium]|nr:dephospho-CoA kinase [Clostridiales bacterium]
MKIIGITGGIGAGKSLVLEYLAKKKATYIVMADQVAHQVKNPGTECYHRLVSLLGKDILDADLAINKNKLAEIIFLKPALLSKVNEIIHPAVKEEILKQIEIKKAEGKTEFFFIEAALLIEDGYLKIVDELWYIYADEKTRKERLKTTRNYSDEKINSILKNQLLDSDYRKYCETVIDNSSDLEHTYRQIDRKLEDIVAEQKIYPGQLVFGLDIGTRSIVGTVGYKDQDKFYVVAQYMKEHETRSMMDGQIHDIDEVGKTITMVKEGLEKKIGRDWMLITG